MRFKKNDLLNVLSVLSSGRELFVPGLVRGIKQFKLWQGEEPVLDGENTLMPPKDILFPKTEKMYSFKTGENTEIDEIVETPERVIFGLRPCDMRSIECMDSVFIKEGYTDTFYARRREKSLVVALACPGAGENCFCEAMGVDPNSAPGADIFLRDGGEFYAVSANTERGRVELERWSEYLYEAEDEQPVNADVHCALRPAMSRELSERLPELFGNDEFWKEVSSACYHCGTCSFVCPTCYCFDINNANVGDEGVAFRCWDSCMFSDYNQNAGGHNTRPTKKEKLRNRYMHKLSYFHDRHGVELCVGCGRCIAKCPAHLDIAEFIDKAAEVLKI